MDISISKPRGDTIKIRFSIKMSGIDYELQENDRLYFTIKKSYKDVNPLKQYTYGNGITYDQQTKKYTLIIPSIDTSSLEFKTYSFDIELVRDFNNTRDTTTLAIGELEMTEEITSRLNEG